jgi:hypothetical protein
LGVEVVMKVLLGMVTAAVCLAAGPDTGRQIRDEIARLERSLAERPITNAGLVGMVPRVTESLKSAASALDAGRTWLALERLGQAVNSLEGLRAASAPGADFEKSWADAAAQVSAIAKEIRGSAPPAALAMRETAIGRAGPLLEGARGFAAATGPSDGLYYIGQAVGEAEFARFLAGLSLDRGRAWRARSMLPELMAIQQKANLAFVPPKSIDLHPRFIALNSAIKLARELDAAKSYHGALYQYLEAVRQYGMLDQPPVEGAEQAKVREQLQAASKAESISALFIERALGWAEHGDPDEWRAAAVIAGQVLPAYAAAMKGAPALTRSKGRTVEVTLVRWPYT